MSPAIGPQTGIVELAAIVSQALEAAGVRATLSGGGAVSVHTENAYESADLDFVTSAGRAELEPVLEPLGFRLGDDRRHFVHSQTPLFLEFPASPLEFGSVQVAHEDVPPIETPWGPLRVTTPTLCVMDRLSAFWHWKDRQSLDQAVMIATHREVDFSALEAFARSEGVESDALERLRAAARRSGTLGLGSAIHSRVAAFGGVELELPEREPGREPPSFDDT